MGRAHPQTGIDEGTQMIRHDGVDPARAAQFRRDGSWGDASLVDFWDLSVRACPDKLAVVDSRGTRWTYRQVDERARRLAGWLRAAGVRAGDVVSVSARALISSGPLVSGAPSAVVLTHGGIRPQRIDRTRRVASSSGSECRRTTVLMVVVGATL